MNNPVVENQLLVLSEPFIVGKTELATPEHYRGGIPVRAVEDDLQCIINPWATMKIGDLVEVFWDNLTTPVRSIRIDYEEQVNQKVVFKIPKGFILDGAPQMFYRVSRDNQTPEDFKPPLTLLVKLQRPGGFDDSPEDGHSGLKYTLIPDVSNGVDLGMAERGIQMLIAPYENITPYDRIICRWGSQEVAYYPVTQEQIDDPINHPILVTFSKDVIESHGDGADVAVTYQVIDRVGNYPDERAPWAKITRVLVDMKGDRLTAPQVLVNGKPVFAIDLEQLGEGDVIVSVHTYEKEFNVNDEITVTWTGKPAQGQAIIIKPAKQTVEYVNFNYNFVIPSASVHALAQGWASVSYERKRQDAPDQVSITRTLEVNGAINLLQSPSVDEAPGGQLSPDERWATVRVPWYPGRKSSDHLTLIWEASTADGTTVYYDDARAVGPVPDNDPVLRSVINAEIKRFNGLRVKVYYRVANDDVSLFDVRNSLPMFMQVGVALPQFVRPEVDEAEDDDTLNPEHVPPTGATLVAPHTGTLAKDRVSYRWRGLTDATSTIDLTTHSAGQPVKFTVPKKYVIENLNGPVVANYTIHRDGQLLGSSAELKLSIGEAQTEMPPPTVLEAPNLVLDPNQHRQGFTVRFNTAKLQPDVLIELAVTGRPAEGSAPAQRKPVNGQPNVDFNIAPVITAANLGQAVALSYSVVRPAGATASQTVQLSIGTLLLQSMPRPLIEGFTGEVLQTSSLKDTSKVLCDPWPFQLAGNKIWLTYVERFSDGTTRSKEQFVGVVHDQAAGLSYATEVQWLRECKAGSKVEIGLKVGLFRAAMVSEAVECQVKIYTVSVGVDELTTFTGYDWDRWIMPNPNWKAVIVRSGGEHFVESVRQANGLHYIVLQKVFQVDAGGNYEFSFDYQAQGAVRLYVTQNRSIVHNAQVPASNYWLSKTMLFDVKLSQTTSPITLLVELGGTRSTVMIDNIRLRRI